MTSRLSSLPFGSLLVYPSRAASSKLASYKYTILAIKQDQFLEDQNMRRTDYTAKYLIDHCLDDPPLQGFFAGRPTLVPLPQSGLPQKDSHWPAKRIADALAAHGVEARVQCLLERGTAIRKSAGSRNRPSPEEHYNSYKPALPIHANSIILVDDVVTRGATALGAAWRILEAIPEVDIKLFAVARTISQDEEVREFVDPVTGTITHWGSNSLDRRP